MPEVPEATGRRWQPAPLVLATAGLHTAGIAAALLAPQRWPWIAGALVANHVVLSVHGMTPRSPALGPVLTRLPAAAAQRGEVALTFDDGPDPEVTPRVLDLLDRWGARGSFFCIGRRVAAHPDIAAEIVHRGHRLENHTWSHPNLFSCYGPWRQRREIVRAQEAIAAAAGRAPAWFRAPAGLRNIFLDRELSGSGLRLAAWTRRGYDTVVGDPARVAGRLVRGLAAGDVLLLHDGSAARDQQGAAVVLEALPRVLDAVAASGLRPVRLDEAF